jgi:hypothetical protein
MNWETGVGRIVSNRPHSSDQKSGHVLRGKLDAQGRAELIDAAATEVFVEVAQRGRQGKRLDAG